MRQVIYTSISFFELDFLSFLPEFFFIFGILFLLTLFVIVGDSNAFKKPEITIFSIKCFLFLFLFLFILLTNSLFSFESFSSNFLFAFSSFTSLIKILLLLVSFFCLILSISYFNVEKINIYEFSVLFALSLLGLFLLVSSNDLLSFYLAVELQSLSFYILAALKRDSNLSTEASLKYFVLGAVSSAFLLFGFAILFGFTGLTNFTDLAIFFDMMSSNLVVEYEFLDFDFSQYDLTVRPRNFWLTELANYIDRIHRHPEMWFIGFLFISMGLLFKLGVFPFYIWIPDVYEGVPTIITAIFSIVPKIAVISFFVRLYTKIFFATLPPDLQFFNFLVIAAGASILFGGLGAIYQLKIKRIFAYSAISHTGFLILGLSLSTFNGLFSFFLYLVLYLILSLNFFSIFLNLRFFSNPLLKFKKLSDFSNLAKQNPILGICLSLNFFSMAGVPPLAGFFSKAFVFMALLDSGYFFLSAIIISFSVISSFFYIRLIKNIYYSKNPLKLVSLCEFTKSDSIIISITTLLNVLFFYTTNFYFDFVQTVIVSLFSSF
jgi:NADH-quinone oxidoreductase subunit N